MGVDGGAGGGVAVALGVDVGVCVGDGADVGDGEALDGDGEAPTTDVVVAFAVLVAFTVLVAFAVAETLGLVPVFVDGLVQPAIDSEAIITSATIAATFFFIRFTLFSSWKR